MAKELVVLNGASNIARSVVSAHLARTGSKYSSVKLIDARPYRQSVYQWQRGLSGMKVHKCMARSAAAIDLGLEGAQDVVYFTHDYVTMSSDKNSHLVAAAKLTKKHGVKNFVAVCPVEHNLAWTEDEKSCHVKAQDSENEAIQANANMTLLKTNLAFGPQSHLIHYLTQCAIVGSSPYSNLVSRNSRFEYAPIHTDDIASAMGSALEESQHKGAYTLSGKDRLTLSHILSTLETKAGKSAGSTQSSTIPGIDLIWEFFVGNTNDQNLSQLVAFYEANPNLANDVSSSSWHKTTGQSPSISFENYYANESLTEENFAHPTMGAYKCAHLD